MNAETLPLGQYTTCLVSPESSLRESPTHVMRTTLPLLCSPALKEDVFQVGEVFRSSLEKVREFKSVMVNIVGRAISGIGEYLRGKAGGGMDLLRRSVFEVLKSEIAESETKTIVLGCCMLVILGSLCAFCGSELVREEVSGRPTLTHSTRPVHIDTPPTMTFSTSTPIPVPTPTQFVGAQAVTPPSGGNCRCMPKEGQGNTMVKNGQYWNTINTITGKALMSGCPEGYYPPCE